MTISFKASMNCYPITDYIPTPAKQDQEGENAKMTTMKDYANAYEAQQTRNISELENFSVDTEVTEETHTRRETGEEFTIKVMEINGEKYRVPNSVLEGLKALMQKIPTLTHITVLRTGTGMQTRYQVVPLTEAPKMVGQPPVTPAPTSPPVQEINLV